MSHLLKLNAWEQAGFDKSKSLQVLPVKQQTTFYLVAGNGLDVKVDDPRIVAVQAGDTDDKGAHRSAELTAWEKDQVIRKIVVTAKNDEGSTKLRAQLNLNPAVDLNLQVLSPGFPMAAIPTPAN